MARITDRLRLRGRTMVSSRARAMARTTDRLRLRGRTMVSYRARAWECVYVLRVR